MRKDKHTKLPENGYTNEDTWKINDFSSLK